MQDYPGRIKLWHVGVPPSGPMDALAFRLANALVGNEESAAGLEITLSGAPQHVLCCAHRAALHAPAAICTPGDTLGPTGFFTHSVHVALLNT